MSVSVMVPATTANLGPGFDCLGLALALHNHVIVETIAAGLEVIIEGEGAGALPVDRNNLVVQAAERVFARVGRRPAGLRVRQQNRIPVGSGLGSSAAAVLAGLLAANELVDGGLSPAGLLKMAVDMEGHPDNAAAALYGGLVIVNQGESQYHIEQVALPPLSVVLVLPQFTLSTATARAALPDRIAISDAVFNTGRVAILVQALINADYEKLVWATADRLHEPYRLPLIPGAIAAKTAGIAAGAAAVVLSGAGPSLLAFAPADHESIAQAMQAAFAAVQIASRHWILPVDGRGALVNSKT